MILFDSDKKISWRNIGEITFLFFSFTLLLGVAFLLAQWFLNTNPSTNLQAGTVNVIEQPPETATPATPVVDKEVKEDLEITATSAISVEFEDDVEGTILFEKDSDKRLPIASLVKMMTALIVLEDYDLDKKVVISKEAMAQFGEQGVLKEGQVLSVKNLLYISLIESSNRAAYALGEVIGTKNFIALMNEKAKELGLADTYFSDSTGLDEKSYSTANNLVKLSGFLFLNYPLFGEIVGLKEFNLYLPDGSFHHKLANTNELLGQGGIIGGKTGYTNAAKGCIMVLQKKSLVKRTMYIILGADDRFSEMKRLIEMSSLLQYQLSKG